MKNKLLLCLAVSSLIVGCNSNKTSTTDKSEEKTEEISIEQPLSLDDKSVSVLDSSQISETEIISSEEISSSKEQSSSEEEFSSIEELSSSVEEQSSSIIEESSSVEEESPSVIEDSSEEISTSEEPYWTNNDVNDYYNSIDLNTTGTDLLEQLQSLNSRKRKTTVGYNAMLNASSNSGKFLETDYDPKNPTKLIAFYRGTADSPSKMNREHVWPKSHGGNLVDSDIHMPRPTLNSDNSDRGNSFYVEGKKDTKYGWDPYTAGMTEYYRGVSARIIFYCCVASSKLSLVDIEYSATSNANPDYKMGKLSDLLKWNLKYPVVDSELIRNNGAQKLQGNRNPFIDNPHFACAIWGSYNSTTKQICSSYSQPKQRKSIPVKTRILEQTNNINNPVDNRKYKYN